eukprot:CAMPEP_0119304654 /NCGR_PEP_ID=MMETSP1333-20130426/5817_1 /TAXON_ID=418940 /ORGANISM="Scyphosphaera apsteinii, Strain RCC1455" /LENGTH=105 /DNA_ID=CAMNT_0007307573 /DNA_START=31 /DNA_END=348 /DNA_ORIENTATION=-
MTAVSKRCLLDFLRLRLNVKAEFKLSRVPGGSGGGRGNTKLQFAAEAEIVDGRIAVGTLVAAIVLAVSVAVGGGVVGVAAKSNAGAAKEVENDPMCLNNMICADL